MVKSCTSPKTILALSPRRELPAVGKTLFLPKCCAVVVKVFLVCFVCLFVFKNEKKDVAPRQEAKT